MQIDQLFISRVRWRGRRRPEHQQVLGIEPRIHLLQVAQALDEQPGANEQEQSQSHLRRNQYRLKSSAASAAHGAACPIP